MGSLDLMAETTGYECFRSEDRFVGCSAVCRRALPGANVHVRTMRNSDYAQCHFFPRGPEEAP